VDFGGGDDAERGRGVGDAVADFVGEVVGTGEDEVALEGAVFAERDGAGKELSGSGGGIGGVGGEERCEELTRCVDTHVLGFTWTTLRVSDGRRRQTQAPGSTRENILYIPQYIVIYFLAHM
jgi:hypothetical protein